jgi:hypothetical protein
MKTNIHRVIEWIIPIVLLCFGSFSAFAMVSALIRRRFTQRAPTNRDTLPFPTVTQTNTEPVQFYIPVPTINWRKLFSFVSSTHEDAQTNYLNNMSRAFDFLYKNYVNYVHKLSYGKD